MRFEPANSKYFAQEICSPSFTDSLRLLGCFSETIFGWKSSEDKSVEEYQNLFSVPINDLPPKENMNNAECSCILMRLLYDMAIDILDKSTSSQLAEKNSVINRIPIIVYPCIINSMFQLIPFIPSQNLCYFLVQKMNTLFSLERNLQVMCDMGLVTELLNCTYLDIFLNEKHSLHSMIQSIFERLSSHHILPKDLRFVVIGFVIVYHSYLL